MQDVIYQATTWRRTVMFADDGVPFDPDDLVACLCPETPITVSQDAIPVVGTWYVTLTDLETADLDPGSYHWEILFRVGSDVDVRVFPVDVRAVCVRFPT